MNGYGGRLLFVDLTAGATGVEPLTEPMARALLGGNGFAARILYDRVPAGVDAFDPANAVVFAVGPITDTTVAVESNELITVSVTVPFTAITPFVHLSTISGAVSGKTFPFEPVDPATPAVLPTMTPSPTATATPLMG